MEGHERVRKLKWLCRRGMKELDVLLDHFVVQRQLDLARGSWPELESLLAIEDDQLWDWFQDPSRPAAAPYRELLELIRHERG